MSLRWLRQVRHEVAPSLERGEAEVSVDVPARRAGTARRRLRRIADHLEPEGYRLEVYRPVPHRATGRFGIAVFRREAE